MMQRIQSGLLLFIILVIIQFSAADTQYEIHPAEIENTLIVSDPAGMINMGKCPELKIPDTGKKIYSESFDSYSSGTLLKVIPGWKLFYYAEKNPDLWIVTNTEKVSLPNSLRICGDRTECAGGNADFTIPGKISGHILFKAKIRAAGLSGNGCFENDIGIDMRSANNETSTVAVFIHSKKMKGISEGLIFTSDTFMYYKQPISTYKESINKWISIVIEINPIAQQIHFWADGRYHGFLVMGPEIVGKLTIFSGDGQGWIDDIEIFDQDNK